jgi:hypothetical protein
VGREFDVSPTPSAIDDYHQEQEGREIVLIMTIHGSIQTANCGQPAPIRLAVEHHPWHGPEEAVDPALLDLDLPSSPTRRLDPGIRASE